MYLSPTLRHTNDFLIIFFILNVLSWATQTQLTNLIHESLRFTTKGIIDISKVCQGCQPCTTKLSLTLIQQLVLTTASIISPTRTLLLFPTAKALQLRFGVPPSQAEESPPPPQTSIHKYPCFVRPDLFIAPQHTGLVHHTLSSLLFSCRRYSVKISTTT